MAKRGSWEPGVVVTRTPLRISFFGGGTDVPSFYDFERGAVLSTTIDKYIYVTIKPHGSLYNEKIRLNYSETELVNDIDDLRNEIARESLRLLDIDPPIYISTVADVPAASGLGSSSTFAVGLLNALHIYRGDEVSAGQLAEEACHVEMNLLGKPIGKQDQYAAAYGGLNYFTFEGSGKVTINPTLMKPAAADRLISTMQLYWTGITRQAETILAQQKINASANAENLIKLRSIADHVYETLFNGGMDSNELGSAMHESWEIKKQLANKISSPKIEEWYATARDAGAIGGKLCGAGGGGFLFLIVPKNKQAAVTHALGELEFVPFKLEFGGTRCLLPVHS